MRVQPGDQWAAVDNDVILKACSYELTNKFWTRPVGVLGAARFVVQKQIARGPARDKDAAHAELKRLLSTAQVLDPDPDELRIAAELEYAAQREGLSLDQGESQLTAIVVRRGLEVLETGDKRAVKSLEQLTSGIVMLRAIAGKVRCLEQVVLRTLVGTASFDEVSRRICSEPEVDKALSICFSCFGGAPNEPEVVDRLRTYVEELRTTATRVLAPN